MAAYPGLKQTQYGQPTDCNSGMELRDLFAAHAITGLMTGLIGSQEWRDKHVDSLAVESYKIADAMMLARDK